MKTRGHCPGLWGPQFKEKGKIRFDVLRADNTS